ncbi:hypothetical protein JWV26_06270 [Ectopseudomonas toyotomiensis]|jgi:hypothetical protein|uniref:ParE-like toxin domain-containing protein n=1 Tax=Ectopseudomonas toyotomiensis TaxID=554344 RepID=A0ABD7DZP3_9GAMM|nr:hypothetical protein [Pseudomonas toyotomiensis]QSL93961.1 hypothetical protein JWV26_06270 [Pseudomonas toyotomiensis]
MHTIQSILTRCPHQVSPCHQHKALEIDQALRLGTPFTALGGKRVRCRNGLVRFKLGCAWRLLYRISANGYVPHSLVSRQCFERELKRRRALKP